jgi:cyclopropane fatty-acyl-phospholipid synthase-like methyltransferase
LSAAPSLAAARDYVGTTRASGELQLELLQREGCTPTAHVLEVGCGCLNAGLPVMRYLHRGHYVGIEPNRWLLDAALAARSVRWLVRRKHPTLLERSDFDAGELGRTYDYVLSHSILSHCAHHQLEEFLRKVSRVLRPDGRIVASIRLAEGNAYGSTGTPDRKDSLCEEWQYPDASWFGLDTVERTAAGHGLRVELKPEYTERFTQRRPLEIHDWLVFSHAANRMKDARPSR